VSATYLNKLLPKKLTVVRRSGAVRWRLGVGGRDQARRAAASGRRPGAASYGERQWAMEGGGGSRQMREGE
jgi:hypothetical protein